jgi:hypothetical protein
MIYFSFPAVEFNRPKFSDRVVKVMDELVQHTFHNKDSNLTSITLVTKNIRSEEVDALSEIYVFFLTADTASEEHLQMEALLAKAKKVVSTFSNCSSDAGVPLINITVI